MTEQSEMLIAHEFKYRALFTHCIAFYLQTYHISITRPNQNIMANIVGLHVENLMPLRHFNAREREK